METLYFVIIAILGLIVGSFLNVVIYRLPRMLYNEANEKNTTYNLFFPRSQCPHCQRTVVALDNIPVLSFILLKARCRYCREKISWRYPSIEILTMLLSIFVFYQFGFSIAGGGALLFTWCLISLTFIDLDEHILPDDLTLFLLWVGIAFNITHTFVSLEQSVLGAMLGYLFLWAVYWLFKALCRKEGLGYGDFKLLAALGAWVGCYQLPMVVLFASLLGTVIGLVGILFKRRTYSQPIAFGPFLALAGWISLIWGDKITQFYLSFYML